MDIGPVPEPTSPTVPPPILLAPIPTMPVPLTLFPPGYIPVADTPPAFP